MKTPRKSVSLHNNVIAQCIEEEKNISFVVIVTIHYT